MSCMKAESPAGRGDPSPPFLVASEKETLLAFLDYLREAIVAKLDGVSEDDARRPGVPSGTSLLGLVKHLWVVELAWFVRRFAGEDVSVSPADMALDEEDTVANVVARYRAAIEQANDVVSKADIDDFAAQPDSRRGGVLSLRWILVHMIEETARHAGHADILREQIDGAVGR